MQITEHALGVSFNVEDEGMARAWHVVAIDGDVWLIDPADAAGTVERAEALGTVRGVIQLLDRHERDNAALADRFGVPLHRLPDALPDTPFEVITVLDRPGWHERALWAPQQQLLVVAEVVGAGPQYRAGPGKVGVHPMLRLRPPGHLERYAGAQHLLMGHGPPVSGPEAGDELVRALKRSRRDLPLLPLALLKAPRPFRRSSLT